MRAHGRLVSHVAVHLYHEPDTHRLGHRIRERSMVLAGKS